MLLAVVVPFKFARCAAGARRSLLRLDKLNGANESQRLLKDQRRTYTPALTKRAKSRTKRVAIIAGRCIALDKRVW
jgi:hypothetical protein